jgi:DeoR family glycerol-3-phosphate regulon repressor
VTVQPLHPTLSARQNDILNKVRSSGFVTIEALAAEYGVSTQTVRRDLIALAKTGLLQRFHGGAGPADDLSAARLDYREKRDVSREGKGLHRAAGGASYARWRLALSGRRHNA